VVLVIIWTSFAVGSLQLYAFVVWNRLFKSDPLAHRHRVDRFLMRWADRIFAIYTTMMRIKVEYKIPPRSEEHKNRPALVISNHRSSVDVFILPLLLRKLGYAGGRGIVKESFRWIPIIGRLMIEGRAAFVRRGRDDKDIERVRAAAQGAREDGVCMMIFPEGTVLREPRAGSGLSHVLPPKAGGVHVIREVLHDYPILSVTIHSGGIKAQDGTSIASAGGMYRNGVVIEAEFIEGPGDLSTEEWLNAEWRRKEKKLAATDVA